MSRAGRLRRLARKAARLAKAIAQNPPYASRDPVTFAPCCEEPDWLQAEITGTPLPEPPLRGMQAMESVEGDDELAF